MSDNGTYQQQRRGQLTEAADVLLPEAIVAPGGEQPTDSATCLEAFTKEAEHMTSVLAEAAKLTREQFLTSREFPLPIYRALIYKRLHEQGCSTVRIGKLLGNVSRKGQVGALMLCHLLAIDVDSTRKVHSVKVEDAATTAGQLRRGKASAIPEELVRLKLATHAGECRLG